MEPNRVTIQWLGHAAFRIEAGRAVVYIDPWKIKGSPHDATAVLVSHSHFDHYSAKDIEKVSGPNTKLLASADVVDQHAGGQSLQPGSGVDLPGLTVTGVAAYNPAKQFHPKANNWLGFVVEIGSKRIYYAGDTDVTDEMKALENIDLALLPVGGTYTMDAGQAAEATGHFRPARAIPYHWGDIVGQRGDAESFASAAACEVTVLDVGGHIVLE